MGVRRVVAACAVAGSLLACSSGSDPTPTAGGTAASAPDTGASTTAPVTGDAATAPSTVPGTPVDIAGATAALDAYLDALAANDFNRALASSRDSLALLTFVRQVVERGNADRGGTTANSFAERQFTVASATVDTVQFTGRAVLTSTVTGPAGPPATTTDTISDVVVRAGAAGWRAAAASYNGSPLVAHVADATNPQASASTGPVTLTLVGSLSFGNSVAVIVQVVATGAHTVGASDVRYRIGDEEAASTSATVVTGQPGFVYSTFPRRDDQPALWRATITVDGQATSVVLRF